MPSQFDLLGNQYNAARLDQGAEELAAANQLIQSVGNIPPVQQLGGGGPTGFGLANKPMEDLRSLGANFGANWKANQTPPVPTEMTLKRDPVTGKAEASVKMSQDDMAYFQKASQFYQQALGGYAQEANRLEMQQKQVEGQPWVQLATALSANLAQQKDMPGWVQGLGRTAAQLNPTADELRARRLAVMGKEAEMAEKGMALGIAQQRTLEDQAARKESEFLRQETLRKTSVERAIDNAKESIKAGTGAVDANGILNGIAVAGATPQELKAAEALLGNLASNVKTKWDTDRSDRAAADARADANLKRMEENSARLGRQFAEGQRRMDERQEKALAQSEFTTQYSKYEANTKMSVAEQTAVNSSFNVMNLVGKIEDAAGKAIVNPITGYVQYKNPFRPAEWQAIKLFSNQMLLSGLAGKLGAGVSDRDVTLMKEMVPSGRMTQEQFDATNRILRSVNTDNLRALMRANPNIEQWKTLKPQFEKFGLGKMYDEAIEEMKSLNGNAYPALFGPNRPAIAERTFGADTKAVEAKVWTPEDIKKLREAQGAGR